MNTWLRTPALHFLVLGALLFFLAPAIRPGPDQHAGSPTAKPVLITPKEAAGLRRAFERRTGTTADEPTAAALTEVAIEEEILVREALVRGLDRADPAVRARLLEKMRFLEDEKGLTEDEQVDRARALGLDRNDPLIRRILSGRMKALLAPPDLRDDGSRGQLLAYFLSHQESYQSPEQISLRHVFLNRAFRGNSVEKDAADLLTRLRSGILSFDQVVAQGDPSPVPLELRQVSLARLTTLLGPDFTRSVQQLDTEAWQGPISSAYGLHLVRIDTRKAAVLPDFKAVENRVRLALRAERRDARLLASLKELRARYKTQPPSAQAESAPNSP